MVKNLPAIADDVKGVGLTLGLGRSPGGGHGNPLQNSCLENPHVQRSLAGFSPQGCKELDTTERLSTAPNLHVYRNFAKNMQISTYKYKAKIIIECFKFSETV